MLGERSSGCRDCGNSWDGHFIRSRQMKGGGFPFRFRCPDDEAVGPWTRDGNYHPLQPYEIRTQLGQEIPPGAHLAYLAIGKELRKIGRM